MSLINKLKQITEIQNKHSDEKVGEFNKPITQHQLSRIETLLKEPLIDEWKELYQFADGQTENGNGLFLGERFINSDEIIRQIEFSLTLVKPDNKYIRNEAKSNQLLSKIADFLISKVPKNRLLWFKKTWFKIEFKCSVTSYDGPYLYTTENTSPQEREIFKIDIQDYNKISETIIELYELEKESYNWDKLEFVVYADGKFVCERTFYDFDNQINFTSTPENAIKKKYFHYKWLPVFSDYGGNYIGIDLDPDTKGKIGQIINFGRDEENMIVLANSLNEFFDFILIELEKPNSELVNNEIHLHDILKRLKT